MGSDRHPFVRILRHLVLAVVAWLALVPAKRSRDSVYSQEVGAMRTICSLHVAQSQYFSLHGRFAGSIEELASAGLSPPDVDKGGYRFAVFRTPGNYIIRADP